MEIDNLNLSLITEIKIKETEIQIDCFDETFLFNKTKENIVKLQEAKLLET